MARVSILAIDRPREPASERANPPGGVYEDTDDHSRAAPPSPLRHRARHRRHKHALAPCIGAQRWIQAELSATFAAESPDSTFIAISQRLSHESRLRLGGSLACDIRASRVAGLQHLKPSRETRRDQMSRRCVVTAPKERTA